MIKTDFTIKDEFSKLPNKHENFIDGTFNNINYHVSPLFKNYNFNPNMITTLSNISCVITILLLLNAKYYWAALFFMIAYYFDCLDGYFARRYDMVTVFGDYYDHISDITKISLVLLTLYYIDSNKFFNIIPIIIIFGILSIIHIGCQEYYYNTNESPTLNYIQNFCPVNDNNVIQTLNYTKYFGLGTFNLVVAICIIYYDF